MREFLPLGEFVDEAGNREERTDFVVLEEVVALFVSDIEVFRLEVREDWGDVFVLRSEDGDFVRVFASID